MKKFDKINVSLIIIIIASIILRFIYLDKPNGLSYDEIIGTYNEIHQTNLFAVIAYVLKTDIHFPLYQAALYGWSKIFLLSDYSLRAFSAVCGVITVVVSFFVGKELKSKNTGLICAGIFAINSFLIYYSQEVRMYAFISLISTIFLLFIVRVKNDYKNKWNYLGLVLSAFAVTVSYTVSAVFVLAQILMLIIYLLYEHKENKIFILKRILISSVLLMVLCSPVLGYMFAHQNKYLTSFNGYYCDWSSILVMLQNWFTPVLQISNPPHYFKVLFSTFNISTLFFIIIPIVLAISIIIYALKKDKFSIVLFGSVLIFLLSEIIAVRVTNFKIIPRYTMTIVPNLLILVGYGFSLLHNKKHLKTIILSIFLIINLSYLIFMDSSAFRIPRDGFKQLAQILIDNNVDNGDFVILWNNRTILDKYIDKKLNTFGLLGNIAYTSEVMLQTESQLKQLSPEKRKTFLRPYFISNYIPQNNIYLMDTIYKHMKYGQKFIISTNNKFDVFTQKSFTALASNDEKYKVTSYNELLTIKALIDIKKLSYKRFHFIKRIENGSLVVIIFKK